jgi:hypothetical protein
MGVGPIPYSSIRRYADEYNITSRDEFDFFLSILGAMDAEYLSMVNKSKDDKELVPVSDVESQHLLFDRLRERANRSDKVKKKKK